MRNWWKAFSRGLQILNLKEEFHGVMEVWEALT
jgi:hypothetical protein